MTLGTRCNLRDLSQGKNPAHQHKSGVALDFSGDAPDVPLPDAEQSLGFRLPFQPPKKNTGVFYLQELLRPLNQFWV